VGWEGFDAMTPLTLPNAGEPALGANGTISPRLYEWMAKVTAALNGPFQMRPFAIASLPASPEDGWHCFVTDAGGGAVPVYSRGGQWLRYDDNTEVT
jgi:hypothetical protein